MFSQPVKDVMEQKKLLTAPPETTVYEAARMMAKRKVGAVLIVTRKGLGGIFTERDALTRVLARNRDPHTTTLADVMTPDPLTIDPHQPFGYALLIMHEHGFRHVPVIDKGKLIGIVSARNALDPDMEEFVAESQRREQFLRARR